MFHFRINTVIVIEFPIFSRTLTIRNSEWTQYSSKRGSVVPAPPHPPSSQPTNCNLNAKVLPQLVMSHYNDTLKASFSWSANAHVKWGLCSTSFWLLLGFNFFCDLSLCLRFRKPYIRRFCTSFSLIILKLCRLLTYTCPVDVQMVSGVMFD